MSWLKDFAERFRAREAAAKAKRERQELQEQRERQDRQGSPSAGRSYRLMGQPIVCACSSSRFVAGSMSMHSRAASFFNVEWMGDSAVTLTCVTCGRIQLFAWPPEQLP
jgi:hypothetical protein